MGFSPDIGSNIGGILPAWKHYGRGHLYAAADGFSG
jgi:hypothetical protein